MRTPTLQRVFLSGLAISASFPSMIGAQVRPATPQRTTGSGQPWQCLPSDSIRAFNRTLRADSLARERARRGGVTCARGTGGTRRSYAFPAWYVVLDVRNLCAKSLSRTVDSPTAWA